MKRRAHAGATGAIAVLVVALVVCSCSKDDAVTQPVAQTAVPVQPGTVQVSPPEPGKSANNPDAPGTVEKTVSEGPDTTTTKNSEGTDKPVDSKENAFDVASLSIMPASTFAALVVASPKAILDRLNVLELIKSRAEWYSVATTAMIGSLQYNFLDIANFEKIGLDINKQAGVFFFSTGREHFGVFVSLSNADAFYDWLKTVLQTSGEKYEPMDMGEYRGFHVKELQGTLLVGKNRALLVSTLASSRHVKEAVAAVVEGASKASLSSSDPVLVKALSSLAPDHDVYGFFRPEGILSAWENPSVEGPQVSDSRLESHEKRPEQPSQPVAVKGEAPYQQPDRVANPDGSSTRARRQAREAAEVRPLLRAVAGNAGSVVGGLKLGTKGVAFELKATGDPECLLSRVFQRLDAAPAWLSAVPADTRGLAWGRFNLPAVKELVDLLLAMDGTSYKGLLLDAKLESGIDLAPLVDNWTGDVLFFVNGSVDTASDVGNLDAFRGIGFGYGFRYNNPEQIEALMKAVGAVVAKKFPFDAGKMSFEIPTPWRTVHIAFRDGWLTAGTDPNLRLGVPTTGQSWLGSDSVNLVVRETVGCKMCSGGAYVDAGYAGEMLVFVAGYERKRYGDYYRQNDKSEARPLQASAPQEAFQLQKDITALQSTIDELEQRRELMKKEAGLKSVSRIGALGVSFMQLATGSGLAGVWTPATGDVPAFTELVVASLEAFAKIEGSDNDVIRAKRAELIMKRDQLEKLVPGYGY